MRVARLVCSNGHCIAEVPFEPTQHTDAWASYMLGFAHSEAIGDGDMVCAQCDATAFTVEVLDQVEAAEGGG